MFTVVRDFRALFALLVAAAAGSGAGTANAAVIGTYTFAGADPAGDGLFPATANATFTAFARTNVTGVSLAEQFASTAYTDAASIDLTEYVSFTITANPGFRLDLESISFNFTRNDKNANRTGPQNGAIRASFESNFTTPGSGTGSTFAPTETQQLATWNFTDFSTPPAGSASFRIYGWNSVGNADTDMQLRLDNVTLNGAVVPIPEPSDVITSLGLAVAMRRRRSRPLA